MKNFTAALIAVLLLSAPACAAKYPAISDADLNDGIELGQEIEVRADGDLNDDGLIDTAYVVASPDRRTLYVLIASDKDGKQSYDMEASHDFETYPLVPGELSIKKGVLIFKDVTGGTLAMASTYRYHMEKARMRLIGLDAILYSRTYAHGGFEMSWNLLNHNMETAELQVNEKDPTSGYIKIFPQKFKWFSNPIMMEDTPDPEMVMIDVRKD